MDQFLNPETGGKLQFLDLGTDILSQFLFWISFWVHPEPDIMGEWNFMKQKLKLIQLRSVYAYTKGSLYEKTRLGGQ